MDTIITTTTPSTRELKKAAFHAYVNYVKFISHEITIQQCCEALRAYADLVGYDQLSVDTIGSTLTLRLTSYGRKKGELGRDVKSITTFRKFFEGGWEEVEAAPVRSRAGADPDSIAAGRSRQELETMVEDMHQAAERSAAEIELLRQELAAAKATKASKPAKPATTTATATA